MSLDELGGKCMQVAKPNRFECHNGHLLRVVTLFVLLLIKISHDQLKIEQKEIIFFQTLGSNYPCASSHVYCNLLVPDQILSGDYQACWQKKQCWWTWKTIFGVIVWLQSHGEVFVDQEPTFARVWQNFFISSKMIVLF